VCVLCMLRGSVAVESTAKKRGRGKDEMETDASERDVQNDEVRAPGTGGL
jgi:hypothetical protein